MVDQPRGHSTLYLRTSERACTNCAFDLDPRRYEVVNSHSACSRCSWRATIAGSLSDSRHDAFVERRCRRA